MTRIITADEARALAAKWKGYDGPYGVSWDDEGDCVVHYDDMTVARVAHFDGGHTEPLARLFAAAPDDVKALAATVIVQATKIERLSGFLPAVAVVVCPACGVDITADLDDDAEYITRRHSRRAPARIGLGEIVWCDGGIARAGGSRG